MSAIDSSAAAALVAAAAGSLPPDASPDQIRARAFDLLRIVPAVVERAAILEECRAVTGVIANVEDVKGRAVITIHATMGEPSPDQQVVNGRPVEHMRTEWLSTPAGVDLATRARNLVGRHCRFGKRVEQIGPRKKVSMCEWIEDLGPDPEDRSTPADVSRQQDKVSRQPDTVPAPAGPVALCSDTYRKAILAMARQLLIAEDKRDAFAKWRTAAGIPTLQDPALTAEQAARVRTFLAGMYDQVGGAA